VVACLTLAPVKDVGSALAASWSPARAASTEAVVADAGAAARSGPARAEAEALPDALTAGALTGGGTDSMGSPATGARPPNHRHAQHAVTPSPLAAQPPPADAPERPDPPESSAPTRRWLALERLGVLQVLGGVAISLIALFSSDGPRLANRGRLRAFLALMAGSDQL
jgi:hypothetical protein